MTPRRARRLLIVGWDAADWLVADPLIAAGRMPNLARLLANGARADLHTLEPRLSPILWTSIATGKTGDKHGVLNFLEPNPTGDGLRITSSTTRRTKALWNILSQRGLTTHVVGWYASHPAEPIQGSVVSNLLSEGEPPDPATAWPVPDGVVHPSARAAALAPLRVHRRAIPEALLNALVPAGTEARRDRERMDALRTQLARAASVHGAALQSLRDEQPWDCAMVFYDAIDTLGHHFMPFRPPRLPSVRPADVKAFGQVMDRAYQLHDAWLGELLAAAGADTTVMLLSDHGFYSDQRRPIIGEVTVEERAALEASWHRPVGILAMAGPGIAPGAAISSPTLLDIAPTALALLGLPRGADMDGRVLLEAFAPELAPALAPTAGPASSPGAPEAPEPAIPSWDLEPGPAGLHPEDVRQDPFEARDALRQLIDLGYMPALDGNLEAMVDLARRETQFNLAAIYMTTGRPALAVPVLAALADAKPDEPRYTLALARCLMACTQLDECAVRLRRLLDRHPDALEARMLLVGALANAGDLDAARRECEPVEAACRTRPELACGLGDVLSAQRRWPEAEAAYQRAVARDPADAAAWLGRARAALATGQYEPAAEHALEALQHQPGLAEAHHTLGAALAWLGHLDHAQRSLELALALQPGSVDTLRFLALVADRRGHHEAAAGFDARAQQLEAAAPVVCESPGGPGAWKLHLAGSPGSGPQR